jgi:hypothetical protein
MTPWRKYKDFLEGMNRIFQGAATVDSILNGDLIERAADAGLRSLFVGFEKTVAWAIEMGLTTSTFHIATPYPDTPYYKEIELSGRLLTKNWDLYDTRHVVFQPKLVSAEKLEQGYHRAYDAFYQWGSIVQSSLFHGNAKHQLKHFFYTSGWKKLEPMWNAAIQLKKLGFMTPMLEAVLSKVSKRRVEASELAVVEHI